jgi:hypothetical protein
MKPYHIILPILFIPVCLIISINYGWIGYATLTERPGIYGNLYEYYNLTRPQFYIYNFFFAAMALVLILFQVVFLIQRRHDDLRRTFWSFGLLMLIIIIGELYMGARFIGKG